MTQLYTEVTYATYTFFNIENANNGLGDYERWFI
jgi:hypothetical protein